MVTTMILAHWLGLTRLCPLCVCERERDGATDKSNDLGEAVGIVVVVVLVAQKQEGESKDTQTVACAQGNQMRETKKATTTTTTKRDDLAERKIHPRVDGQTTGLCRTPETDNFWKRRKEKKPH